MFLSLPHFPYKSFLIPSITTYFLNLIRFSRDNFIQRTRREFGAWCRLVAIPFSSFLPWRLQYGTHLEQNCFRFHQNPWPRQDDPLSCIYCIYSLLWDSTRVLAATAPTLGGTLDIGVMTTDIPAQQPGTAALLTGERCLQQFNIPEE